MRGAPQPGFSRHIFRIRSRISRATTGRPGCPCRTFQVQNKLKHLRCQATTVSGLTMTNVERQSRQRRNRQTQKNRSPEVNFGRLFEERRSTQIWWRSARFSSWRSPRERMIERRATRSAAREICMDRVGRKYNSRPLRSFRVFERHSVTGTLKGRKGSFVLQHSATMNRGVPELSITVVPDSGSHELQGLIGKMNIIISEGKHSYEFDYMLADKP